MSGSTDIKNHCGPSIPGKKKRRAHWPLRGQTVVSVVDEPKKLKKEQRKNLWNFKATTVAITIPRWREAAMNTKSFEEWVVAMYIQNQMDYMVTEWCFAQEKHADGGIHVHGYMKFGAELHTRDCNFFDKEIDGVVKHCNYQPCRSARAWLNYIQKDGNFCGTISKRAATEKSAWHNYRKTKEDKAAYDMDQLMAERKQIEFPLVLPWMTINKPNPAEKKRHWWICGPPSVGKTLTLDNALKDRAAFWCAVEKEYRFEGYLGEEIVIYDDCWPGLQELICVSNTTNAMRERPCGRRFTKGYFEANSCRTIIVLANVMPPQDQTGAFNSRFNVREIVVTAAEEETFG